MKRAIIDFDLCIIEYVEIGDVFASYLDDNGYCV